MPLADTLENYKRQAIIMMRAAQGYDYRAAFTHFGRIIKEYADARTHSRSQTFEDLLCRIAALTPAT